jgi:hypothetical protein
MFTAIFQVELNFKADTIRVLKHDAEQLTLVQKTQTNRADYD